MARALLQLGAPAAAPIATAPQGRLTEAEALAEHKAHRAAGYPSIPVRLTRKVDSRGVPKKRPQFPGGSWEAAAKYDVAKAVRENFRDVAWLCTDIAALDFDPRPGEDMPAVLARCQAAQKRYGLTGAICEATGHGYHLIAKAPPGTWTRRIWSAPHLVDEVRCGTENGNGLLLFVANSWHPVEERRYQRLTPLVPLAELPVCPIELLAQPTPEPVSRPAPPPPRLAIATTAGAGDWASLDVVALFRDVGLYVGELGKGKHGVRCPWESSHTTGSDGTDTAIFEARNGTGPGFQCLHAHCAERDIRDVREFFGAAKVDAHCVLPFRPEPARSRSAGASAPGQAAAQPGPSLPRTGPLSPLIICAAELAAHPELLVAPDAVIPGLAWKGRVTLFASREKFGKSTTLAAGIAALSLGKPFLGEAGAFGRCLYWSADRESLADQLARLRRFGANLAAVDLVLRPPVSLEEVARHLDGHDVLVVDTLASASPDITDAFSSSQWGPLLLRYVDLARRAGCAVILVHHANKSTGKYRDSTSIGATVDVIVEMAPGADPDTRELSTVARWPALAKRCFRLAGTTDASWLEVVGALRPQLDARLLAAIEEAPHLSATAYVEKLGSRKGDVLDGVERLAAAGAIRNIGTAKAPKWERVSGSVVPTVPNGSGNHSAGDGDGSHPFRGEPDRTAAAQDGPATEHGNRSEPPPAGCPECGQIDWTWLEGAWRCENCARESAA